jgi:hypothetical protein
MCTDLCIIPVTPCNTPVAPLLGPVPDHCAWDALEGVCVCVCMSVCYLCLIARIFMFLYLRV